MKRNRPPKTYWLPILFLILIAYNLLARHFDYTPFIPSIAILFLLVIGVFPEVEPRRKQSVALTDYVLEKRFGKYYNLIRYLGPAILVIGYLVSEFSPDKTAGIKFFFLSIVLFFLYGIWLCLVIADGKARFREKYQNQEDQDGE